MAKFTIGIVGLGKNPHVRCFEDVAKGLGEALRALGHQTTGFDNPGRLILFGANNLFEDPNGPKIPDDTIIFNSEQLAAVQDPTFFLQGYLKFKQLTVWDYSYANVEVLRKLGIRGVHCPIGFVPGMKKIPKVPQLARDIDVLHYGSVGDSRRREILDALDKTNLKVERLFGVYGEERDAVIARAKLVVNLHYYERGVFEIFRVSHLLANKKAVLTEAGGCDSELETFAQSTCAYVERDRIVDTCVDLVRHNNLIFNLEENGYLKFRKMNFVENVRRALIESEQ